MLFRLVAAVVAHSASLWLKRSGQLHLSKFRYAASRFIPSLIEFSQIDGISETIYFTLDKSMIDSKAITRTMAPMKTGLPVVDLARSTLWNDNITVSSPRTTYDSFSWFLNSSYDYLAHRGDSIRNLNFLLLRHVTMTFSCAVAFGLMVGLCAALFSCEGPVARFFSIFGNLLVNVLDAALLRTYTLAFTTFKSASGPTSAELRSLSGPTDDLVSSRINERNKFCSEILDDNISYGSLAALSTELPQDNLGRIIVGLRELVDHAPLPEPPVSQALSISTVIAFHDSLPYPSLGYESISAQYLPDHDRNYVVACLTPEDTVSIPTGSLVDSTDPLYNRALLDANVNIAIPDSICDSLGYDSLRCDSLDAGRLLESSVYGLSVSNQHRAGNLGNASDGGLFSSNDTVARPLSAESIRTGDSPFQEDFCVIQETAVNVMCNVPCPGKSTADPLFACNIGGNIASYVTIHEGENHRNENGNYSVALSCAESNTSAALTIPPGSGALASCTSLVDSALSVTSRQCLQEPSHGPPVPHAIVNLSRLRHGRKYSDIVLFTSPFGKLHDALPIDDRNDCSSSSGLSSVFTSDGSDAGADSLFFDAGEDSPSEPRCQEDDGCLELTSSSMEDIYSDLITNNERTRPYDLPSQRPSAWRGPDSSRARLAAVDGCGRHGYEGFGSITPSWRRRVISLPSLHEQEKDKYVIPQRRSQQVSDAPESQPQCSVPAGKETVHESADTFQKKDLVFLIAAVEKHNTALQSRDAKAIAPPISPQSTVDLESEKLENENSYPSSMSASKHTISTKEDLSLGRPFVDASRSCKGSSMVHVDSERSLPVVSTTSLVSEAVSASHQPGPGANPSRFPMLQPLPASSPSLEPQRAGHLELDARSALPIGSPGASKPSSPNYNTSRNSSGRVTLPQQTSQSVLLSSAKSPDVAETQSASIARISARDRPISTAVPALHVHHPPSLLPRQTVGSEPLVSNFPSKGKKEEKNLSPVLLRVQVPSLPVKTAAPKASQGRSSNECAGRLNNRGNVSVTVGRDGATSANNESLARPTSSRLSVHRRVETEWVHD